MRYKPEWKGRLRVANDGLVYWNNLEVGRVSSRHVEGAKSPGGMVTNTVWMASRSCPDASNGFTSRECAGMLQAVEFILEGLSNAERKAG